MRLVGSGLLVLFLVLDFLIATTVRGQAPGPIGLPWVRVPAGVFQIGCVPTDPDCLDNERPRHEVTLSLPFDLMATEVTVAQYLGFTRSTNHRLPPQPNFVQRGDHPIVLVDWDDAVAFCGWAGGRLPTEAEWEYAARAGHDGRIYGWGDALSSDWANFGSPECCEGAIGGADQWVNTAPVGSLPPNDFGLYDMSGNVWEWVADWYGIYGNGPSIDPRGAETGLGRVARGGSWLNFPGVLRVSVRLFFAPSGQTSNMGIRCARDSATTLVAQ